MKKNKPIPKAWKKKKHRKNKNLIPFQKKAKYLKQPVAPWKITSILFFSSLIITILVVPTLVVVPFAADDSQKDVTEEVKSNQSEQTEITMGNSPFAVTVMRASTDKVENVPLETYVSRVVASEMPSEFELEALKAQALAARTFIVDHMVGQDNKKKPDVTDTTAHQVYNNKQELRETMGKDFKQEMHKIKKAVAATKGEIITYNNEPITAAYFSTSNGYTENSEDYWINKTPYLRSVKSPWDKGSPKFLDQKIFTIKQVEDALEVDLPKNSALSMKITRTEGKRVDQLKIAGKSYSGKQVREALKLRSSDFEIEQKNGHLIFTTQGFGHGIGMSQYGANGMAKHGKNYKQIIKHYYQGVEISSVTDTAPTLVSR